MYTHGRIKSKKKSARQELGDFASAGDLRYLAENSRGPHRLSAQAVQLLVDVVLRYCEPRKNMRKA